MAYLFERFPRFEQTFCWREVRELERQGVSPLVFSLRDPREKEPPRLPREWYERVVYVPPAATLAEQALAAKAAQRLPRPLAVSLNHWQGRGDKGRVHEAAWIGEKMRNAGVRHIHAHFAGAAARTAWWLHWAFGFTYSFTGHANDIFVEDPALALRLARLVEDARFVAVESRYAQTFLQQEHPAHAAKIKLVYNGLEMEPFAAVEHRETEPPLILSVGRLIEKKGYPMLIAACARLRDRGLPFRCEIIGDGPLKEELAALITSLDLADRVALTGPASTEEIIQRLTEARVFALACAREQDGGMDNLPTVIMEAMAARVPCVSTRLAGVPEMIEHDVTGLLVGEGETEPFTDVLVDLLADPARARQMGEAGFQHAQRLFTPQANVRKLVRHLAGAGGMRFDARLVQRDAALGVAYTCQFMGRLRPPRPGKKARETAPPDFLVPKP